jgi:hypothetical protein
MNQKDNKFPVKESYQSVDGNIVEFEIYMIETPQAYILNAEETPKSRGKRFGYRFNAFASDSPSSALENLRKKINKELSVKYLEYDEYGHLALKHNKLVGRIDYSDEDNEIVIEADGIKISLLDFWKILPTYEGFEFEFKIED